MSAHCPTCGSVPERSIAEEADRAFAIEQGVRARRQAHELAQMVERARQEAERKAAYVASAVPKVEPDDEDDLDEDD